MVSIEFLTLKELQPICLVSLSLFAGDELLLSKNRLLLDAIATNLKDQNLTTNIDSAKRQIQVRGRELC